MTDPHPTFVLSSDLARLGEVRAWVAERAGAEGFQGQDVLDLEVVMTEAVSNVVRHAYGGAAEGRIEIGCTCVGEDVVIRIRDWGGPFADGGEPSEEGGYGLGLIEELADSVHRTRLEDGNLLEIVKRRPKGRP